MEKTVNVVITSCKRQDLLEKTFDSFIKMNKFPITKYIIIEDSELTDCNDFLQKKYSYLNIELIYNNGNIGQAKSIDKAYSHVDSNYIFHCEDDWEFYNSGFIEYSFAVLESDDKIITCWLREDNDTNGHPINNNVIEKNNVKYRIMSKNYLGVWHGFTWNPSLIRKSDYDKIGNYSEHGHEPQISQLFNELGYHAAKSEIGYVKHIGWDRHVN